MDRKTEANQANSLGVIGKTEMIPHTGNGCPVPRDAVVTVQLRSGKIRHGHRAEYWDWWHSNHPADVMAYQVERSA